jgi:hypothetical protein
VSSTNTPDDLHDVGRSERITKREPSQKDFDLAFDELAYFLLEEYRKHKEKVQVTEPISSK